MRVHDFLLFIFCIHTALIDLYL